MDLQEIFALMDRFDSSLATGLELTKDSVCLKLTKAASDTAISPSPPVPAPEISRPVPAVTAPEAPKAVSGVLLKAPLVGTFYSAPAPDKAAFVTVGDTVKKGQTVCVLEAMKMMSEVPASVDCVIEEILVKDGELVGFEAPLFRVREL